MSNKKVLIISGPDPLPPSLQEALNELNVEGHICIDNTEISLPDTLAEYQAAVMLLEKTAQLHDSLTNDLTEKLHDLNIQTLVLAQDAAGNAKSRHQSLPDGWYLARTDESREMLKGRLSTLIEMRPRLKQLTMELQHLRTLSEPLGDHLNQFNEEMRLAARLQQDFLPRTLPELPGIRFATIYRPASWISGDIYDIMRLDENHLGLFITDVVGHGTPAALLTMYIKRALITKEINDHDYHLIEPGRVLERLNTDMLAQDLSNFQFATCFYGILNFRTLELRAACAGHPPPMLIRPGQPESELEVHGTLIGVFPEAHYTTETFHLQTGDKLLLYSDGVELAFINEGPDHPLRFRQEFGDHSGYDIHIMCEKLLEMINSEEGSLHPRDDVTIVGLEFTEPTADD